MMKNLNNYNVLINANPRLLYNKKNTNKIKI